MAEEKKIGELTRRNEALRKQVNELTALLKGTGATAVMDPAFQKFLEEKTGVEKRKLSTEQRMFEAATRHGADAYKKAMDAVKNDHAKELKQRNSKLAELAEAITELERKHAATIAELEQKHALEAQKHASTIEELKQSHASETQNHASTIEELKKSHASETQKLKDKLAKLRALKTSRSRSPGIISKVKRHFMSKKELDEYNVKHKEKQDFKAYKQKEIDKARKDLGPGAISRFVNRIKGDKNKNPATSEARKEFRRKLKEDDWEAVHNLY